VTTRSKFYEELIKETSIKTEKTASDKQKVKESLGSLSTAQVNALAEELGLLLKEANEETAEEKATANTEKKQEETETEQESEQDDVDAEDEEDDEVKSASEILYYILKEAAEEEANAEDELIKSAFEKAEEMLKEANIGLDAVLSRELIRHPQLNNPRTKAIIMKKAEQLSRSARVPVLQAIKHLVQVMSRSIGFGR